MAFDMKWLNQKREMAKRAKLQSQNGGNYFPSPLRNRYKTGFGEDGINQPNNPVMKVNTMNGQRMIHEGEEIRPSNGGQVQVVSQKQLREEELSKKMPGYQEGGVFTPEKNKTLMGRSTTQPQIAQGDNLDIVVDPLKLDTFQAGKIQQQEQINPNIGLGGQLSPQPSIGTQEDLSQEIKTPELSGFNSGTQGDPSVTPEVQPSTVTDESKYQKYLDETIARLEQLAKSGSVAESLQASKQLADLKATQNIERQVESQQMAQERITGPEAYTRGLMGQAQRGADLAGAEADIGIESMKQKEQASRDLAGLALQGMQFEFGEEQFYTSEQWKQKSWDFAIAQYGDAEGKRIADDIGLGMTYDQIREKYPNVTQEDYDSMKKWSQMGFAREQWEQSNVQWEESMAFAKEQYGDKEGQRLYNDIAAGIDFTYLKEKYPTLTRANYDKIYEGTPLAQNSFNRQQDVVSTLLTAGGADNLLKAKELLKDMYGVDVDLSSFLREDNMGEFNEGMSQVSKHIKTFGDDWDNALAAMKKDGTLELLGMDATDAKRLYESMKLNANPVYQISKAFPDELLSSVFPDMDPKEARAAITRLSLFGGLTMNPDGTFSIDTDLFKELFGIGGEDPNVTPSNTYADYKKAVEAAGETPMSEDDWKFVGSPGYEKLSVKEQHQKFVDSLPEGMADEWTYPDWVKKGRPYNYDIVERNINSNNYVQEIEKDLLEYRNDGWPVYENTAHLGKLKDWMDEGREIALNSQKDVGVVDLADIMKNHPTGNSKEHANSIKAYIKKDQVVMIDGVPYRVFDEPGSGGSSLRMAQLTDLRTGKGAELMWIGDNLSVREY